MLTLTYERTARVLLASFSGIFSSDDLYDLDLASADIVLMEGPVRSILDFTAVQTVAVPATLLIQRGRQPQIFSGQRSAIVAPQNEVYDLARSYANLQRDFGNVEPLVVQSFDEALRAFHLKTPKFQPLLPGLRSIG